MTTEERLDLLAARRHGLAKGSLLRAAGMTESALRHQVRSQRLFRVHRDVYAVGRPELSREGRWMAAVLACGPGAALSHASAALLWRLLDHEPDLPHVTIPTQAGRSAPRRIVMHRSATLTPADVRRRNHIPVTGLPRTLADLAARLDPLPLKAAVRQAERLHGVDLIALRAGLDGPRSAPGPARLRRVLDDYVAGTGLTEEELELRFLDLCAKARLPLPVPQFRVGRFRADFAWEEERLLVETDGRHTHDTVIAFGDDRAKDRALRRAGFDVMRFTWAEVLGKRRMVAGEIREALARRRRELGLSAR